MTVLTPIFKVRGGFNVSTSLDSAALPSSLQCEPQGLFLPNADGKMLEQKAESRTVICILASLEVSVEHNSPRKLTAGESWLSRGGFVWGNKRVGGGENWGWKGQRLEWEAERVRGCCPLCFLHTAPSTWISRFPICVHQAASFSSIRLPTTHRLSEKFQL